MRSVNIATEIAYYPCLLNLSFGCTLRDKSIVKINLSKETCFVHIINIYEVEILQVFSQIHQFRFHLFSIHTATLTKASEFANVMTFFEVLNPFHISFGLLLNTILRQDILKFLCLV